MITVEEAALVQLPRTDASPLGRECAADRRILAPNDEDLQMYPFETSEV